MRHRLRHWVLAIANSIEWPFHFHPLNCEAWISMNYDVLFQWDTELTRTVFLFLLNFFSDNQHKQWLTMAFLKSETTASECTERNRFGCSCVSNRGIMPLTHGSENVDCGNKLQSSTNVQIWRLLVEDLCEPFKSLLSSLELSDCLNTVKPQPWTAVIPFFISVIPPDWKDWVANWQ